MYERWTGTGKLNINMLDCFCKTFWWLIRWLGGGMTNKNCETTTKKWAKYGFYLLLRHFILWNLNMNPTRFRLVVYGRVWYYIYIFHSTIEMQRNSNHNIHQITFDILRFIIELLLQIVKFLYDVNRISNFIQLLKFVLWKETER